MNLRVTFQTIVNRSIGFERHFADSLGKLQEQINTGKRLVVPSDDPLGAVAVINGKAQDIRLESDLNNIRSARTALDVGVSSLQDANNILVKARELAIEASNSANDQTALSAIATEVEALFDRLVDVANTQHNGSSLFAGTRTDGAAFTVNEAGAVVYQGGEERAGIPVSSSQITDTFYVGREVFQRRERGETIFTGSTGAAPGTGTDSATGQGTLVVAHTTTTYGLSEATNTDSGVAAGTGSAAGDTIIGPAGVHELTLIDSSGTGASGTVSLNGGSPVTFTNADTNLKVTGPDGEIVYLDTTSITPGFNSSVDGDIPLTANGTLSSSGGLPVAINFSSNQTVTDTTGGVTNVDTTNIRRTGTTFVSYTGTYDAFQSLQALRDDLRNVRGLPGTEQLELISARIADLDQARETVLEAVGEQSASLQNLQGLEFHAEDVQLETKRLVGEVEAADLAEVVIRLQTTDNLFRMTLASSARLIETSLLDFLR